jgi:hypothetical protein
MPGASATYTLTTRGKYSRLSLLTMLVNTNDGFTGLDARHLRGQHLSFRTFAYDAGSETNNERTGFIPGPCCNNPFVRDPEGALIRRHEGITGRGELLAATYGWSGAVARITVHRMP